MPIVADAPLLTYGSGAPDRWLPGSGVTIPTSILDTVYEYNGLRFNNRTDQDHYFVKSFDGLSDADVRQATEDNPDRDGQTLYGGFYGARPMSIEGYVRAGSLPKLEDMWYALRQAFDVIDRELPLVGRTGDVDHDWQIFCCKSGQLSWKDEQTEMAFKRPFMIPLKATDPAIYGVRQKSASQNLNSGNTLIVRHLGNREAVPRIIVNGQVTNLTIVNNATKQTFRLTSAGGAIAVGRVVTIDFREGTIFDDQGTNRFDLYDHTSDWLAIAPEADNTLTLSSTAKDANASVSVYWYDTYK